MKKVITALAFIFAVGFAQAQTDSTKLNSTTTNNAGTQFEYYPDANVYYNDGAKTYSYYDSTSSKWQTAAELPSSYSVNTNSKKNTFYYNGGGNVWDKNADHVKMYGKKDKKSTDPQQ